MIEVEQQRPSFKGEYQKDNLTGLKKKIDTATITTKIVRTFGYSVTMVFIVGVLAMIIGIFIAKHDYQDYTTWFSLINAIQIRVMNTVYRIVAKKLNDWENYEFDSQYNNALTLKLSFEILF